LVAGLDTAATARPIGWRGIAATLRREARDARLSQIAALSGLLIWNIAEISLGASLLPSLVSVAGCVVAQVVAARLAGLSGVDLRSPLITGLSLSLLLRGDALWVQAAGAALAIGSKFLIRMRGKHLFNPAAFAILVLLQTGHAWVSPGQWGHSVILVAAILLLGSLVLQRAARLDVAIAFIVAYLGLLLLRAAWLGDPPAIPLHQVENGALLLFTCFMITDPRTTPAARSARVVFAVAVAGLAHWLIFFRQVSPGLYVALVAASLFVPILDHCFPARRFAWRPTETSA
jgi:Na+-transporting NADH:ubiquinone oxidoreductase subunit NqrB